MYFVGLGIKDLRVHYEKQNQKTTKRESEIRAYVKTAEYPERKGDKASPS